MDVIHGLWSTVVRRAAQNDVLNTLLAGRSVNPQPSSQAGQIASIIVITIDLAVLIWVTLVFVYVLGYVFPTLAIVESDYAPPAYTELPLDVIAEENGFPKDLTDEESTQRTRPVTSSLRATYRLLRSIRSKWPLFRGYYCFTVYTFASFPLNVFFAMTPFVPVVFSTMIIALVTMPLYTAWTHIVISEPSAKPMRQRIIPSNIALRALVMPTLVFCLAEGASQALGHIFALKVFHIQGDRDPMFDFTSGVAMFYTVSQLLLTSLITIPARAVLVRVQASLLPEDDRPILSLDPAITSRKADGRRYLTTAEAFKSISRAAWVRICMMDLKVLLLGILVYGFLILIGVLQFLIAQALSR
ncbi:hypothetical protein F5Y11DRAFT_170054 [Daldinia sp. FL1419]|nr:hypothetical protein F5Y11DRAFT_170054 [Daldinia sp. FL1419]